MRRVRLPDEEPIRRRPEDSVEPNLRSLHIEQIEVPRRRVRRSLDREALGELAVSLAKHSQLQLLLVRQDGDHFTLITGERGLGQRQQPEREGYIVGGIGQPAPSVMALTSLGSGLAACALLSLLSDESTEAPSGYWVDGMFGDARETEPRDPKPDCWCRGRIGIGDGATPPLLTS